MYGTLEGVSDALVDYANYISSTKLTAPIVTRFLVRASNEIDAKLAAIVSVPLASPPEVINDIAVDLAVCQILKRFSVGKDPDETVYVRRYCDDPLKKLDELIAKNAGLFTDSATIPLALSNTINRDRAFTVSTTIDGEDSGDDDGTMDDW